MTALIGMPLLIGTTLIRGQMLCNIQGMFNFICSSCSLLLTFSISIDRFHAVILPYSYRRQLTYSKHIFIALTMYLSPIFSSILPLLDLEKYGFGRYDSGSSCWISLTPTSNNIIILGLVAFISAGVIFAIISYYAILFFIAYQKSNNQVDNTVCIRTSLRTVLMIVGTTAICWIPIVALTITNVITYFIHGNVPVVSRVVSDMVFDLVITNIAMNPLIYMLTNGILRKK